MRNILGVFGFCALTMGLGFSAVQAGGLDLTTSYGSRITSMGGGHISLATDAYAPFYNPAAMSAVNRFSMVLGGQSLFFQNEAPVGAADANKKSKLSLAPLFFLGGVYRAHERFHVGVAVYPTALQGQTYENVDYNDNLTDKELHVRLVRIEVSPSVSFELVDGLSAGLSYQFGYNRYEKKAGTFRALAGGGSFSDMTVSGWSAKGLKFGVHLEDYEGFSFGVSYRLQQKLKLTGKSTVESGLGVSELDAEQRVTVPMRLEVGSSYRFYHDRMTVALSYAFTQNSKIKTDDTRITGVDVSQTQQPLNYRDGHNIYLGADYRAPLSNGRSYRIGAGYAYDHAVTNPRYPSPVLPPAAAYHGINFGGGYAWGQSELGASVNMGRYSNRSTELGDDLIADTVYTGKYKSSTLGIVVDYSWKF